MTKWVTEAVKSNARKHHLVPASYLQRWAVNGAVRVTDVNTRHSYTGAPESIARETDYYRLEHDQIDPERIPPLLAEIMLGKIEGAAVSPIDKMIAAQSADVLTEGERADVAMFVASQLTRGRAHRARSQAISTEGLKVMWPADEAGITARLGANATDEELAAAIDAVAALHAGDLIVGKPQARAVLDSLEMALHLERLLRRRPWGVWLAPIDLATTDEPVVPLGGRLISRGQTGGVETAHVIVMPLDPHHLLVMPHPATWRTRLDGELTLAEVDEINLDLLAHAHRWRFTVPSTSWLPAVPWLPPAAIVETGVGASDGLGLVHSFSPNRWLYAAGQAWPVTRWWSPEALHEMVPTPWQKAG